MEAVDHVSLYTVRRYITIEKLRKIRRKPMEKEAKSKPVPARSSIKAPFKAKNQKVKAKYNIKTKTTKITSKEKI